MNFKNRVKKWLGFRPEPVREPRMYVVVRNDLAPGHQMAQAAHAATYLAAESKLALYQHPTISILKVPNREILIRVAYMHQHIPGDPELFMFHEPDLGNEVTAFACYSKGEEFAGLRLALEGL